MAIDLTKNNFEQEINCDIPVLVDFWAVWCGPCRAQAPILTKLEQEPNVNVKVCKINVDDEQELAERFEIMTIPTLMVFRNGKPVKRISGTQSIDGLKQMLK